MTQLAMNLDGEWEFRKYPLEARRMQDLEDDVWVKTTVPSSIYMNLVETDQIAENDLLANPENYSCISDEPWIYRKSFDVSQEMLDSDRVHLVFDGLDTIAKIWLNGKLIAKTDNMFVSHRIDVTDELVAENNILLVRFDPPVAHAKKVMERYTSFEDCAFLHPYRSYIRKAQFQFGWDFSPSLPGCGIWRSVRLEGIEVARIEDIHVQTLQCSESAADVKVSVCIESARKAASECDVKISFGETTIEDRIVFKPGETQHSLVIQIPNPQLWWPRGYGDQPLYDLSAQLHQEQKCCDWREIQFGIRYVNIHLPDSHREDSFLFEVNGQPIQVRGANWVPVSVFAGSVKSETYEELIEMAADANMNMLRVWGGGYYEDDLFYQLCDKYGILVWQDFAFACAYYPDRNWFYKEVKKEAVQIIKRLRNHSCLALWCGNNEVDWIHYMGWMGKGKKYHGKAIFHKLLPEILGELDPSRQYIPTSPYVKNRKNKPLLFHNRHNWEVWSFDKPMEFYLDQPDATGSFVTEFGMQSVPGEMVLRQMSGDYADVQAIEKHDYQTGGVDRLHRYCSTFFTPSSDYSKMSYLTQVTQARAIQAYIHHIRIHKNSVHGAMFWQFHDCAPAVSWSCVDYARQPKALYYYAKRFYANRLVTIETQPASCAITTLANADIVSLRAINEESNPLTGSVVCTLLDPFGSVQDEASFPVSLLPFSVSNPIKLPRTFFSHADPKRSFLHVQLRNDSECMDEQVYAFLPDKQLILPGFDLKVQIEPRDEHIYDISLSTDTVIRDLQLFAEIPCRFSDNFLTLLPNRRYSIRAHVQQTNMLLEGQLQFRDYRIIHK